VPVVTDLPFIDEHSREVAAPPAAAWDAIRQVAAVSFDGAPAVLGRVLRLDPALASGPRPLEAGSTLPGFKVIEAVPGERLTLEGRHRFSRYGLEFLVERSAAGATVRARTSAAFPGLPGACYRAVVIGTRGHVLVVRRMLRAAARKAERAPAVATAT
jgi:hypothetical protein